MPNGGSVSCIHCANASSLGDACDIFGTPATPFFLCRHFRLPDQTSEDARRHWSLLSCLEVGVIYAIENAYPSTDQPPRAAFRVTAIEP